MNTTTMNDVAEFRSHYLKAVAKNPSLYVNSNSMYTIVLPTELLEFAEAGAGHSGFGAGARPIGIRRHSDNAAKEVANIFSSDESLYKFIMASEKDYKTQSFMNRVNNVRSSKKQRTITVSGSTLKISVPMPNRSINEQKGVFEQMRKIYDIDGLYTKFGAEHVTNARRLTPQEFVDHFGL